MAFGDRRSFNWGCLVSGFPGAVALPALFGGFLIGGGGREGRPTPCQPDHGGFWAITGLASTGLVILGWLVNRAVAAVLLMIGRIKKGNG